MSNPLKGSGWLSRLRSGDHLRQSLWQQLCLQMPDYKQKLDEKLIQTHHQQISNDKDLRRQWLNQANPPFWGGYFKNHIQRDILKREELEQQYRLYRSRYQASLSPEEAQQHLLDYARALGANKKQLRGDRRAFSRWFGFDAMLERYQQQSADVQRQLIFSLERLACLLPQELTPLTAEQRGHYWQALNLEPLLQILGEEQQSDALKRESLICLKQLMGAFNEAQRSQLVSDLSIKTLVRLAIDERTALWVQVAAVEALTLITPAQGLKLIERWVKEGVRNDNDQPTTDKRIFLRRRLCSLLSDLHCAPAADLAARDEAVGASPPTPFSQQSLQLLNSLSTDCSPYVRQGVAEQLPRLPLNQALRLLESLTASSEQSAVRASALLCINQLLTPATMTPLLTLLNQALHPDESPYIQRVALHVCVSAQLSLLENGYFDAAKAWQQKLEPKLTELHQQAQKLEAKRWCSRAREHLWSGAEQPRWLWRTSLSQQLKATRWGKGFYVDPPSDLAAREEHLRLLNSVADQDFGLDVESGHRRWFIRRGDRFGFRLWRWLHEWRNPDTDKRQGFSHTLARKSRGLAQMQTPLLAELSETKVPGEPLHFSSEDGWRPYLPLPDQLFAALDQGWPTQPLKLYSSEGVTEVHPPKGFWGRLRARTLLSWRFAHFASLRNWHEGQSGSPQAYLKALQTLGFSFQLRTFTDQDQRPYPADAAVSRFFPVIGLPLFSEWWLKFEDYFFSPYQNSLRHLGWFMAAMGSFFIGRHLYISLQIRRARRQMPLVIGGWGTRGKSGTERLKAALFNALGYPLVSKTTGCEAMFLHGPAFGELKELFLYRPYDKATIWEQIDVLRHANALGAKVFLWECMGLTPGYVKILQRQWMRDDIATITNTYPDHENLQGPAGINIPQVMTNFIPKHSVLITSEEQMLPILEETATELKTDFLTINWLHAGLLTPDVLARFPYEEHPYNIALVQKMVEHMGIDANFALKEMADRVVPDLGVLKAYPVVSLWGRRLEYINGMSANERLAALGNWRRMGFADHDPAAEPQIWLSTVINNRADRIPRAQVFAAILANDISADRHYLIGTNLDGFLNYLREAWARKMSRFNLWLQTDDPITEVQQRWLKEAQQLRQPIELAAVERRLQAMVDGLSDNPLTLPTDWQQPEALQSWLEQQQLEQWSPALLLQLETDLSDLSAYQEFLEQIASTNSKEAQQALNLAAQEQLWRWLRARIQVIGDSKVSGNQIIRTITESTPPGLHARIIGMQNIKGAGLDFAYRWQSWEICHRLCEQLNQPDPGKVAEAAKQLAAFQDYGWLSTEKIPQTLQQVRSSPATQTEAVQAELDLIAETQQRCLRDLSQQAGTHRHSALLHNLLGWAEAFLDAGDAIRRRKQAQQIYQDMAALRISHGRAVIELEALNRRQQGGWLGASKVTQQ